MAGLGLLVPQAVLGRLLDDGGSLVAAGYAPGEVVAVGPWPEVVGMVVELEVKAAERAGYAEPAYVLVAGPHWNPPVVLVPAGCGSRCDAPRLITKGGQVAGIGWVSEAPTGRQGWCTTLNRC